MDPCIVRDSIKLRAAIEAKIRANKVTDAELARRIGSYKGHVGKWRRGERSALSQYKVVRLANALGIELDLVVNIT